MTPEQIIRTFVEKAVAGGWTWDTVEQYRRAEKMGARIIYGPYPSKNWMFMYRTGQGNLKSLCGFYDVLFNQDAARAAGIYDKLGDLVYAEDRIKMLGEILDSLD